jgi:hypothetical protein
VQSERGGKEAGAKGIRKKAKDQQIDRVRDAKIEEGNSGRNSKKLAQKETRSERNSLRKKLARKKLARKKLARKKLARKKLGKVRNAEW